MISERLLISHSRSAGTCPGKTRPLVMASLVGIGVWCLIYLDGIIKDTLRCPVSWVRGPSLLAILIAPDLELNRGHVGTDISINVRGNIERPPGVFREGRLHGQSAKSVHKPGGDILTHQHIPQPNRSPDVLRISPDDEVRGQ